MSFHISGNFSRQTSRNIKSPRVITSDITSKTSHSPVGKPEIPRKKKDVMML